MHVVEAFVDVDKRAVVSDVLVDLDLALEVVCGETHNLSPKYGHEEIESIPSTSPGISVRPLTPPKAVPRQVRPVTSWNLIKSVSEKAPMYSYATCGRVEISWPAAATPMTVLIPQPLWQASRAARMT